MKVTVVALLVVVGVCCAAFIPSSLVQQTRPLFTKASLRASIAFSAVATKSNDNKQFTGLVQSLIKNAVDTAEEVIDDIQPQLYNLGIQANSLPGFVVAQVLALLNQLQLAAFHATGALLESILAQIAGLQAILAGNRNVVQARQLLAKLDIATLLQSSLQSVLSQLGSNEFVQLLISQLTPFLDHAQDVFAQISALLTGTQQLTRSAPRGIVDLVSQFRPIFAALQASLGDGVAQAQAIAEGFIAQAIVNGQANAAVAVQKIIAQIHSLPSWLESLAQPLVDILESSLTKLGSNDVATF